MKIALGGDHRGHATRIELTAALGEAGHQVSNYVCQDEKTIDYPDTAFSVARGVAAGEADRGILVCGSGIGSCIAANKAQGIRAALARDEIEAEIARRYHDANILCLAVDLMGEGTAPRVVEMFLTTDFDGGRHARRIEKIKTFERGIAASGRG